MKMMKKAATLLLAVCLVVPCFSMLTHAANAIEFTDPSTAVGETLEAMGVIKSNSSIEDRTIVLTYDTSMLKFKNGDNVTETADGELTYDVKGEQGGTRIEFKMYFDVLKAGTTTIDVKECTIYSTSDALLTYTKGHSTITIAEGEAPAVEPEEPTDPEGTDEAATVVVNGVSYTFSDAFEESDIPAGFVESSMEYQGIVRRVVVQESADVCLCYLVDAEGNGKFFMYVLEDNSFVPFEQIQISDIATITLLVDTEGIVLPETYASIDVAVNGTDFPAWQNLEKPNLCVLYALNSQGEKALYQFDTDEKTYQRFEAPEVVEEEEEDTSLLGKVTSVLENHLDYVILGTGLGFILFIIIILVLSVKLYNRNAELDELYDEYGIDLDEEDETEDEDDNLIINIDEDEEAFEDIDEVVEEDVLISEEEEEEETLFMTEEINVEDIRIAEPELDDVKEPEVREPEVKEPEIKVPDVKEVQVKEVEEAEEAEEAFSAKEILSETEELARMVKEDSNDDDYFDDDEEIDFEMDFIDLDD